jgi:hypothetical protein
VIDNLNSDELKRLVRRIEKLETGAPLGFSSISRGALRIVSEEGLIVEGSAKVTGHFLVTGLFNADGNAGTLHLTGTTTIDGNTFVHGNFALDGKLDIDGDTKITGDTTVTGPLHIDGDTDITGDVTVDGGGKITVAGAAPMTVGVTSAGRPGVEFPGGILSSAADRVALSTGNATVGTASTFAALAFGSNSVVANNAATVITGPVRAASLAAPPAGTTIYQVVADGTGRLYRTPVVTGA